MLLFNVALPAFYGWPMYRETRFISIISTLMLILITNWTVCIWRPHIARSVFVGMALVTVSQVVPIVQVTVGLFTCWLCEVTGLMVNPPEKRGFSFVLTSEAAGFFATMLSALLMLIVVGTISTITNLLSSHLASTDDNSAE